MTLKSKSILIAGGTGGLGSEVCVHLASQGCNVMIVHQEENDRTDALRKKLSHQDGTASFYIFDFLNKEQIDSAFDLFFQSQHDPYAFVNLIGDAARVDWQKAGITQMQDSFLRNASAPLYSAKEFAGRLRSAGRSGAIVLFSSMQGIYPFEGSLFYGAPKAAIAHGAKILAKDFGGNPFIRINAVAPGVNQAGMAEESIRKGKYQKFVDQNVIPKYGSAADIARLVSFLLDPDLYMTGQTILYDGGLTLRRDLLNR